MNLSYRELLPAGFHPDSRVWIYQSNRMFSLSEALEIEEQLTKFCEGWNSHGAPVKGYGNLFFGQFLVLVADETVTGVSGCSTDSSVRFVKEIGEQFGVDFFNRTHLAFQVKDKIEVIPMAQLNYAAEHGFIDADTIYFNNTVGTLSQLENNWLVPVKDSWLTARLNSLQPSR
jgi:hypothetical protein